MKDNDPLSNLVKTWQHTPSEAPDFNQRVWAKLHAQDSSTPPAQTSARVFHFPAAASRWAMPLAACLAVSLAVGSGAAYAYASLTRTDRMATEYARSIDPLQMSSQVR